MPEAHTAAGSLDKHTSSFSGTIHPKVNADPLSRIVEA